MFGQGEISVISFKVFRVVRVFRGLSTVEFSFDTRIRLVNLPSL
jgi:hypothetical protein